jgi:aldose 1-epimerase
MTRKIGNAGDVKMETLSQPSCEVGLSDGRRLCYLLGHRDNRQSLAVVLAQPKTENSISREGRAVKRPHCLMTLMSVACLFVGVMAVGQAAPPGKVNVASPEEGISKMPFGKLPDGTQVTLYTLTNGRVTARITDYGGIVTELHAPDKAGKTADVVLGFDTLEGYLAGHPYFGAITGRYANRIAGGKFALEGKTYSLAVNNGPNSLHGGLKGFDKVMWKAEELATPDGPALKLTRTSPDGEEGYPGALTVTVTYTVTNDDALKIDYVAVTDAPTVLNLTNHSYFNLAGPSAGKILDHELTIAADKVTAVDGDLIPTGVLADVKGTPLDFDKPTALGSSIAQIPGEPGGYDHNYVLRDYKPGRKSPAFAARVKDPKSGRVMTVLTTEPGVQLYTANFLDGSLKGKGGVVYDKNRAFCLETQHWPDSPNHPAFPTTRLNPGETYTQTTVYKFSAE